MLALQAQQQRMGVAYRLLAAGAVVELGVAASDAVDLAMRLHGRQPTPQQLHRAAVGAAACQVVEAVARQAQAQAVGFVIRVTLGVGHAAVEVVAVKALVLQPSREVQVVHARAHQRVVPVQPQAAGAALYMQTCDALGAVNHFVAHGRSACAQAQAVVAVGHGHGHATVVTALGVQQVQADQFAAPAGAVDVQVGCQALAAGGQGAGVVQANVAVEEGFVTGLQHQGGFAIVSAGCQGAGHAHTGQVVGQQQGAVERIGVQGLACGLAGVEPGLQFGGHQRFGGRTFDAHAGKAGFDHLQCDGASTDVLLGKVHAHHPARFAVGGGHGVGCALQPFKAELLACKFGYR